MPKHEKGGASSVAFREAISAADHLQWKPGLQAIRKSEGGGQIFVDDSKHLLGGAAIDEDCRVAYPNDSRWDYVVGYRRSGKAVAYFIEVHSAETSDVSKIHDKLSWLRAFIREQAQEDLAALAHEFHWVASGRINIPKHLPQFKRLQTTLRTLGLKGPTKQLTLS